MNHALISPSHMSHLQMPEDLVVVEEEEVEEEEEVSGGEEDNNKEEAGKCNKGGCPTGSTLERYRAQELARKQAANYVCVKYAEYQEDRDDKGEKRLQAVIREKLIKQAIMKFGIEGKFDVPKQTIHSRICAGPRSG